MLNKEAEQQHVLEGEVTPGNVCECVSLTLVHEYLIEYSPLMQATQRRESVSRSLKTVEFRHCPTSAP